LKTLLKVLALVIIISTVFLFAGYFYFKSLFFPAASEPFFQEINIAQGSTLNQIGAMLSEKGVIKSRFAFWFYVKMNGFDSKLKAGDYVLSSNLNIEDIVKKIMAGATQNISITIPEGFCIAEIKKRLVSYNVMKAEEFDASILNPELLKMIPYQLDTIEGVLFPDTYIFNKKTKPIDVLKMMVKEFKNKMPADVDERLKKLGVPFKNVIIMASIIEKEARHDDDRTKIASVFYNRLKKDMKLESCATIQYALGENRKIRLLISDLQLDSPFNTYKHKGLPPSPICVPSKKSILAALTPDDTEFLFFVAKPDGYHIFSKNFEDHIKSKQIAKKLSQTSKDHNSKDVASDGE